MQDLPILTEDEGRDVQAMIESHPWSIFLKFMENKQALHQESSEQCLDSSVTSILRREQFIGAAKFSKLDLVDFKNFVITQTQVR